MYSDLHNQFSQIGRFCFSLIVLFGIFPRLIFWIKTMSKLEMSVSHFFRMVLLIIAAGYVLVVLRLFEAASFTVIFILLCYRSYIVRNSMKNWREGLVPALLWFYNYIDGVTGTKESIKLRICRQIGCLKAVLEKMYTVKAIPVNSLLLLFVFAYSAYIRFYDAVMHAAPALSDAYVTLAWMKYINNRILFHDGIYPQGFHIYMAVISKFAGLDPLYVLKYTGPLNGILIILGMYFIVSRLTGNSFPGTIAAAIYGVFGNLILKGDWERQVATNSQEFALVFVLPSIYFFYRYMMYSDIKDFWTAASGMAVTGLVHSLAFAFLSMGVGTLIVTVLLFHKEKTLKKFMLVSLAGVGSGIISVLPVLLGWVTGKSFHSSSAEFLKNKALQVQMPHLSYWDYASLACIAVLLLYSILNYKRDGAMVAGMFIAIWSLMVFSVNLWGGTLTKSEVIAARSEDLWSIVLPCCIGMGIYAAMEMLSLLNVKTKEFIVGLAIIVVTLYYKPFPIIPYKMEYDSSVEQYLHISTLLRPTEWMIVSQEEGYDLAYGKGYHMFLGSFISNFDPEETDLKKWGSDISNNIFIFNEKKVFQVNKDNYIYDIMKPIYKRREKENAELEKWVEKYKAVHDNIQVFYEDENLRVFRINIPVTRAETLQKLWGSSQVMR